MDGRIRQHLDQVVEGVASGERLVSRQQNRILDMQARGRDTKLAEQLLATLCESLTLMQRTRRLVEAEINLEAQIRPALRVPRIGPHPLTP
jgi:hypothetical protein